MQPVTLTTQQRKEIQKHLEKETQAYRIFSEVSRKSQLHTAYLASNTATGNISDVVHKCLNPVLAKFGYRIGCTRPPIPIPNRYGQLTQMHEWSLYKFEDRSANDPKA